MRATRISVAVCVVAAAAFVIAQENLDLGFEDTPVLPNQPWKVHDIKRPHPPVVMPGSESTQQRPGRAPSDAVVLFDGKDLSKWHNGRGGAPEWVVKNGYVEVAGKGDLVTKDEFGSCQLHVEWSAPMQGRGVSQGRGNSGVQLMNRYEIQVLDMWNNKTYADGGAGAIYGQWPPLATVPRKPGEWNTYDIVFEAPKFEGGKLVKPAYQTVFVNGVVVHNHKEVIGRMTYRKIGTYAPHDDAEPLSLQNHHNPVRYRNIWIRQLKGYDGQ